jgi:hypothetical protein
LKKDTKNTCARDPIKSPDYYLAFIARMEEQLHLNVKTGSPAVFFVAADYCILMARAAYSAGNLASECRAYLKRSADYQIRFYTEGVQSKLASLFQTEEYLEGFSAAYIAGAAKEVISAFESVKPDHMHPWERTLIGSLESVLLGKNITHDEEGKIAVARMKQFASLPNLFHATECRDMTMFTDALENYAAKNWGPMVDRRTKSALQQTYPDYAGKWSFLSAVMCDVMGDTPNLSKKALQYIPVELIRQFKG